MKRKSKIIIISSSCIAALLVLHIILIFFVGLPTSTAYTTKAGAMDEYKDTIDSVVYTDAYQGEVYNAAVARRVAEAYLGPEYAKYRPFDVVYDSTNNVWVITGSVNAFTMFSLAKPLVIIKKDTGAVVFVGVLLYNF